MKKMFIFNHPLHILQYVNEILPMRKTDYYLCLFLRHSYALHVSKKNGSKTVFLIRLATPNSQHLLSLPQRLSSSTGGAGSGSRAGQQRHRCGRQERLGCGGGSGLCGRSGQTGGRTSGKRQSLGGEGPSRKTGAG